MADLKPCPFCGHSAALESVGVDHFVMCDGCCAETARYQSPAGDGKRAIEHAINAWNHRAASTIDQMVESKYAKVPETKSHLQQWAEVIGQLPVSRDADRNVPMDGKTLALAAMIDAMRWWGDQEDGIPMECLKAFNAAMLALGWSYSHPQDLKALLAAPQPSQEPEKAVWLALRRLIYAIERVDACINEAGSVLSAALDERAAALNHARGFIPNPQPSRYQD